MDKDECKRNVCGGVLHAECENLPGTFVCKCDAPNWIGEGGSDLECIAGPENLCASSENNCSLDTEVCTFGNGKVICECKRESWMGKEL